MRARADWPGLDNAILLLSYQTHILLDSKSGSSCHNNNNNNNNNNWFRNRRREFCLNDKNNTGKV